jgi:hypothetical protein
MSDNKFLTIDDGAETGIREEIKFDWLDGTATQKTTFLPSSGTWDILDQNRAFQNAHDGYTPSRDMQHVASIPMSVVVLWTQKYGVDPTQKGNEHLLARLLNDPEWQWLRTGRGHLQFVE